MTFISIADAKAHFSACIAEAERGDAVLVTRHGKPVAAVVGMASWRELEARRRVETSRTPYTVDSSSEPETVPSTWQPVWGAVPGLRVRIAEAELTAPVFAHGIPWHDQDPV